VQALRTRIETLITALSDPVWRERNALAGLAWYVALWTLYAAFAKGGQDIHFDMGEVIAMSREPLIGTVKHPPLDAWIAGLWFAAFPLADWAYYLLAMISATVGLWVSWRLSARFLDAEKRVVGLALMTLVPFFNFHALKFNANSVLIPVWALTTWWFLRSYETGSLVYAALAGLAAAGAMYGKYWSIFLIAALVIAALSDPRRRRYFTSAAPWVTVAAGAVAFAPHVIWLIDNDFPPLRYALGSHALASEWQVLRAAAGFLGGAVGYLALPIVLVLIAARPNRAALADIGWPSEPQRRLAVVAFILPIVLPVFAALAAHAQVVSLWTMCGATLLPVVLLSSPLVRLPHVAAVRIVTLAVIFPIVMLIASPAIGYLLFRYSPPDNATYSRPLADAIGRAWYETTARPLLRIGSNTNLVNGVVFYLPSRPATYDVEAPEQTPWTTLADIRRDGIALFCKTDDDACNGAADKLTEAAGIPAARVAHAMLSRTYWSYRGPFAQFRIVVVLPQK
jgi:4-amino-4-deoxy-L-arabinose transferase-like glycosyltransferase